MTDSVTWACGSCTSPGCCLCFPRRSGGAALLHLRLPSGSRPGCGERGRDRQKVVARNRGEAKQQRRREGAKRNPEDEGLVQILKFPIYLRVLASSRLRCEKGGEARLAKIPQR